MMDTSKQYILMCAKAEKIQKLWRQDDGDFMAAPVRENEDFQEIDKGQGYVIWLVCDYYSAACYNGKEKKENHQNASASYFDEYSETFRNFEGGYEWDDSLIAKCVDCIWLPRQDQLQEIYSSRWVKFDNACLLVAQEYMNRNELYGYICCHVSKEQAGLMAVMKEKYNKTWNGKEWLK